MQNKPKREPPIRKKHYKKIESENIKNTFEGTINITKQGYKVRLNNYHSCSNCELEFLDVEVPYKVSIEFRSFRDGTVRYPYHTTKFGVGYIGIGKYKTIDDTGKDLPVYTYWDGIMRRCYSKRLKSISKSYFDCSVDERWHNFQVFAEWFYENYNPSTMKGWHLDKDILVKGNRVYSPETCVFLPNSVNVLFTNGYVRRGEYPKGVTYKPRINRYIAQYQNEGIVKHIGTYKTIEEAFQAYKETKEQYIKNRADKWKHLLDIKAYQAMYNYQIEITD
jgi:hypothetical protein